MDELLSGSIRKGDVVSDGCCGGSNGASALTRTAGAAVDDLEDLEDLDERERRGRDVDDIVHDSCTQDSSNASCSALAGTAPRRTDKAASPVASRGKTAFAAFCATLGMCRGRVAQVMVRFGRSCPKHKERLQQPVARLTGRKEEVKAGVYIVGSSRL